MDKLQSNIKDISNNYYKYLMSLENVNGVGYGHKYINNKSTLEPCIHVLVENKIDKSYLTQSNIIPKTYMGIKTDVIKVGRFKFHDEYRKERPLKGGCGISLLGYGAIGTICCIVKKR